ncbi:MAG: phosphatase PAP2 family protein, partial [Promethearchaeota archaeon]
NKIDDWDHKIILKYNGVGGNSVIFILKLCSFFGRETIWLSLMAFYLLIWYDPYLFSYISATFLTGSISITVIKQVVKRKRPYESLKEGKIIVFERKPTSKSFPSWHAYNIVAHGLLIGVLFLNSPLLTFVIIIFAIIVSFSRIQLGVHYPTDVIFGGIFGIIGFFFAGYLMGPIVYLLFNYLETFSAKEIHYRQINPLLFDSLGYLILSISVFFIIFLLAIKKTIEEYIGKNKK